MIITGQMLREGGAGCEGQNLFETEWPEGMEVTETSLMRAFALGLNVEWAIRHLDNAIPQMKYWRGQTALRAKRDRKLADLWEEQKQRLDEAEAIATLKRRAEEVNFAWNQYFARRLAVRKDHELGLATLIVGLLADKHPDTAMDTP